MTKKNEIKGHRINGSFIVLDIYSGAKHVTTPEEKLNLETDGQGNKHKLFWGTTIRSKLLRLI